MKKQTITLMATFLVAVVICGVVSAADGVTVDKTAIKTGADTASVTITVNGPPATAVASGGSDIVFSIDSSGSMATTDPTDQRKTAAKNIVDKLNPATDQAGVVNFDAVLQGAAQPLTNNFNAVKLKIDAGTPLDGTDFGVGIGEANKLLDTGKKAGNSQNIIFLSDGVSSLPTIQVNDAKSKGYKIYTVGLGVTDPTVLQQIATITGGKYYPAADASALNNIYNQIFTQIKSQTVNNVLVTDVLPNYIQLVGSPTIPTTSTVTNPDGTTILVWNIGSLSTGQKWTVTYNVRSSSMAFYLQTSREIQK